MSKKIFNILLVCLLVFITVYFALKISNYGMKLQKEDEKFNNASALMPYAVSTVVEK